MRRWKFITNHALVLCQIAQQPRITAREISLRVGITEKASRGIISDLEAEGYLTKAREGRCNRYGINSELPLRHKLQQDKAVGDLLEILGWEKRRERAKSTVHQA